jgi:hypothetical protein
MSTSAKPSPSPPKEERVGERRPFTLAVLHRRTDCTEIMRKLENQTYLPPPGDKLEKKPARKPPWENKYTHGRGM